MAASETTFSRIGHQIWHFCKILTLNSWRRLRIWGQKLLLWRRRHLLATHYRRFGQEVWRQLQAGDANPLLQEGVKDQIEQIKALEEQVAAREQVVAELRQLIRATSYRLPPPPLVPSEEQDQAAAGP